MTPSKRVLRTLACIGLLGETATCMIWNALWAWMCANITEAVGHSHRCYSDMSSSYLSCLNAAFRLMLRHRHDPEFDPTLP
jgi:hypothetical protein